jgi:hypothetical protein
VSREETMAEARLRAFAVSLALFLVLATFGCGSRAGLPGSDADAEAAEGSPTVLLDDFLIRFPSVRSFHDGPILREVEDPSRADVWFTQRWSSDIYPGEVACLVTLYDAAGQVVGTHDAIATSLASFTPRLGRGTPIEVIREPVSATGSCEPGSTPGERGVHVIGDVHLEFMRDSPRLVGSVSWSGVPDTSACVADLLVDGTRRDHPFTIHVPDGYRGVVALLRPGWTDVEPLGITCVPYLGTTGS